MTTAQQLMEDRLIQLPRPVRIGIGQSRPLRRLWNPQMLQLSLAGRQSLANLPQGSRLPQVTEQHRHKLTPTGEPARVPLRLVFLHRRCELGPREQLQQLCENAAYSIHGGSLRKVDLNLVLENQNPAYQTSASSQKLIWTAVVSDLRGLFFRSLSRPRPNLLPLHPFRH